MRTVLFFVISNFLISHIQADQLFTGEKILDPTKTGTCALVNAFYSECSLPNNLWRKSIVVDSNLFPNKITNHLPLYVTFSISWNRANASSRFVLNVNGNIVDDSVIGNEFYRFKLNNNQASFEISHPAAFHRLLPEHKLIISEQKVAFDPAEVNQKFSDFNALYSQLNTDYKTNQLIISSLGQQITKLDSVLTSASVISKSISQSSSIMLLEKKGLTDLIKLFKEFHTKLSGSSVDNKDLEPLVDQFATYIEFLRIYHDLRSSDVDMSVFIGKTAEEIRQKMSELKIDSSYTDEEIVEAILSDNIIKDAVGKIETTVGEIKTALYSSSKLLAQQNQSKESQVQSMNDVADYFHRPHFTLGL